MIDFREQAIYIGIGLILLFVLFAVLGMSTLFMWSNVMLACMAAIAFILYKCVGGLRG